MYPIILTLLFACEDNKEEATCTFNGTEYAVGESFDADDGCNTCSCAQIEGEDPSISCTAMECGDLEIIDCTILEQEECESTEGCTPIWASPVMLDNENQCFFMGQYHRRRWLYGQRSNVYRGHHLCSLTQ